MEFDADEVNRNFKEAVEKGEMLPTDVHVGMSWFIRKGGGSGCYVPLADNSTPEARAATNRRGIEARDVPIDLIKKRLTAIGHLVPQQDSLPSAKGKQGT